MIILLELFLIIMGKIKYAFRMVHIENIPYILNYGFVTPDSLKASSDYVPIGDSSIISIRKHEIQGYKLSAYVPFYFGVRSPMLYVIQNGYNGVLKRNAEDIVYCVIRLDEIIENDIECIFTDGHAVDFLTSFYSGSLLKDVEKIISPNDIFAKYWNYDADTKRRKEAELLIRGELPARYLRGFCVYNKRAADKLSAMGIPTDKIQIRTDFYF